MRTLREICEEQPKKRVFYETLGKEKLYRKEVDCGKMVAEIKEAVLAELSEKEESREHYDGWGMWLADGKNEMVDKVRVKIEEME